MAAVMPIEVPCPHCGEPISIPVSLVFGAAHGVVVQVTGTPDHEVVRAHIQRHEARLATAAIRYGWTPEQAAAVPEYALDLLLADDEEA